MSGPQGWPLRSGRSGSARLLACSRSVFAVACVGIALSCAADRGATPADAPADSRSAWALSYRLVGGAAGFHVRFEVDSTGYARYYRSQPSERRATRRLSPDELAAVHRAVIEAGFFDLPARLDADVELEDGYHYEIRWSGVGGSHRVIAEDGAALPDGFVKIRSMIGALQRGVLSGRLGAPVPDPEPSVISPREESP